MLCKLIDIVHSLLFQPVVLFIMIFLWIVKWSTCNLMANLTFWPLFGLVKNYSVFKKSFAWILFYFLFPFVSLLLMWLQAITHNSIYMQRSYCIYSEQMKGCLLSCLSVFNLRGWDRMLSTFCGFLSYKSIYKDNFANQSERCESIAMSCIVQCLFGILCVCHKVSLAYCS